ncbi:ubiquitin-like protein Pup [Luteipulveratus mongoliensis]|uniref:Prokaryotic ubiquitin-like protein Pup n=1 Tax=Luteipulveratus mongoliensis TaxID=571913 RepID=A0A0K1JK85_9MICO|nr:ubiquitin-like protein Pup [Luteipulveratus mongoliensis]AKU16998.1 ubiquitin [Luteipulveratus mongoliensis]
MSTQDYKSPQRRDDDDGPEDDGAPAPAGAATKEGLDEDTDGVLDEIDSVLESNAEEFVRGFVQKGGQ